MGWKAEGVCDDVTSIGAQVPLRTRSVPNRQYSAALAAAVDIILANASLAGPWTVLMEGSGMAYPTARVSVSVTGELAAPPAAAEAWTAHKAGILHATGVAAMSFDDATNDPNAIEQLDMARSGAGELVGSGIIGDTLDYRVHLSGNMSELTWNVSIAVERPVAEGYDS